MPIYMKYDGIEGAVTAVGFEKWIELDSCQLGVHRAIAGGARGNRESSTPNFSDISVSKPQDAASTGLGDPEGAHRVESACQTPGEANRHVLHDHHSRVELRRK